MSSVPDRSRQVAAGDVLVVFARYPEPGRVKSRLARSLGDDVAAGFYAAFVMDLVRRFAAAPFAVRWAIAPPDAGFAARFGVAREQVFLQEGTDLGARMRQAIARMVGEGYARCAIIGSDMPQLAVTTVVDAFARLDGADLVLGPAEDGGYYLIAARSPVDVFEGIAWGGAGVLAATRARAATLGLRTALLERGFDIDVEQDLARLAEILAAPEAREAMPATAAALGIERE